MIAFLQHFQAEYGKQGRTYVEGVGFRDDIRQPAKERCKNYSIDYIIMPILVHVPESIVINIRADIAPPKTINLGCLMAMMAAIKKVLSPISDTRITDMEAMNAWIKPTFSTGPPFIVG